MEKIKDWMEKNEKFVIAFGMMFGCMCTAASGAYIGTTAALANHEPDMFLTGPSGEIIPIATK